MAHTTSDDLKAAIMALYDASDAVRVIGDQIRKMKGDGAEDPMWAISTLNAVSSDCASVIGAVIMAERMAIQERELAALKARA